MIALLPESVPEGTPEDDIAMFSDRPHIDKADGEFWDTVGNPVLNRVLGSDVPEEAICARIRRGNYSTQGLCDWLELIMTEAGVNEGLLEGKVGCLSQVVHGL